MKKIRKMMALVIAMVMVLGMATAAFAAPGDFTSTPENTITVEDLLNGDSAEYIQILKEDPSATATKGWTWADGITADADGKVGGLTVNDLFGSITDAQASALANAVSSGNFTPMTVDAAGTTATATVTAPGMFYVKVTPGATNDYIYNPIIVSADYYEGGNTISSSSTYAGGRAIAKKQPVTVKKDYENKTYKDVAPGDEIEFTVTTKIPSYTDAYSNKEFYLTDILQSGLELKQGTVAVAIANYANAADGTEYKIRENKKIDESAINGYSVEFQKDFLDVVVGNPEVTITYTAIVKEDAAKGNVTEMDNDITLTYTHDYEGHTNEITKKTRHYTFGIDASLLGETGTYEIEKTEDLVKVGVDSDNNPIYVSHTTQRRIDNGNTTVAALEQATFKLEAFSGDCLNSQTKEWNPVTTNPNGEISVTGLDAGVYKLTELSAPAGFIVDTTPHYVEIQPHYQNDAEGIPYLTDYEILWGDDPANLHVVKSYTMTNDNPDKVLTGIKTSHIQGSDTQIKNTQGVQLPSTGGMGTTLFYIIGAVLVIGAGIVLVTRRRMSAN